jgi:hypothetical protein
MTTASTPALLFIATDVDPAHEDTVNRWYDTRHIPQRQALPGFLSARRYVAAEGSPKYAVAYDLESAAALKTDEYRSLSQPPTQTDEDREMLTRFSNTLRGVLTQVSEWVTAGGFSQDQAGALRVVGLEPPPDVEEEYNAWYEEEHLPGLIKVPGVLRVRRFKGVEGGLAYLTVWDLAGPEVRETESFVRAAETPWTHRMRAKCKRTIGTTYRPLVPAGRAG